MAERIQVAFDIPDEVSKRLDNVRERTPGKPSRAGLARDCFERGLLQLEAIQPPPAPAPAPAKPEADSK